MKIKIPLESLLVAAALCALAPPPRSPRADRRPEN